MGGKKRGPTQVQVLLDIAPHAALFHAPDGTAYADLVINGHRETWPVRSKGFKRWITRQFFEKTRRAPNSQALQSALNCIESMAYFDAPLMDVHVRVGGHHGKVYLDLTDDAWRAVEIDAGSWRIVATPPIRFRRAAGMLPLPEPVRDGSIDELRDFLNITNERDFVLAIAWLLAALRDHGPYPVIVLSGEQGSAKSTFSRVLRSLVDPNSAPLRALPREDRELFIAARNGHVLCFDNVSGLRHWLSDTFCRLATGGGFAVRQLYTDDDEILFEATRPVILNGIEDFVTRPDLADRSILLSLTPIPEDKRRTEKELWTEFSEAHPRILGSLLDAVSVGLRRLPDTELDMLPRMADFALWSTACEGTFWEDGTFMQAYAGNRDEAIDSVIESDAVASAVRSLIESKGEWSGTATDLLEELSDEVSDMVRRAKSWPASPRALSNRLTRAASFLRKVGIDVSRDREGRARTRTILISHVPSVNGSGPSASSAGGQMAIPGDGLSSTEFARRGPQAALEAQRAGQLSNAVEDPIDSAALPDADGADEADAEDLSIFETTKVLSESEIL